MFTRIDIRSFVMFVIGLLLLNIAFSFYCLSNNSGFIMIVALAFGMIMLYKCMKLYMGSFKCNQIVTLVEEEH